MRSNENTHQIRQSPGGNSSLNLSWDAQIQPKNVQNTEEKKINQELQNERLEKILKAEARRKEMCKKEVRTSVKVNKPPGGVNNFFFG